MLSVFSDAQVLEPIFRLQKITDCGQSIPRLFVQTFRKAGNGDGLWHSFPQEDWPLLATILPDRIITHPIHINPHAKRYLDPKNGPFDTVVYIDDSDCELADSSEEALAQVESRLDFRLFDPPSKGLGFTRDLESLWKGLTKLGRNRVLLVSEHPEKHSERGAVSIGTEDIDHLRRAFSRVHRNGRSLINQTKHRLVHDELLTKLEPARFQRIAQPRSPLVEVRRESVARAAAKQLVERRKNVQKLRDQLTEIARESPQELIGLHDEIKRVALARMIEAFKSMLDRKLPESHWQDFFERNRFVLSIAFARPVELARTQFHAKGSSISGGGAQIGDFLFKERGQALAIIEIKTPDANLLQGGPYRGQDIFGPHSDLSGAVTQVLFQQSELRQRWHAHKNDEPTLRDSGADVIKCVVLAGRTPSDPIKLRSFEVFRNACKDVEVVTFDELLRKLEYLEWQLTPMPEPAAF